MIEFLNILKLYGAAIIGYGFIFIIVLRLFKNKNYMQLSLVSLITTAVFFLSTLAAVLIDGFSEGKIFIKFSFTEKYYVFLIVSFILLIIFPLTFFLIGKKKHQRLKGYGLKKEKASRTVLDKRENIYVVFKHNGSFLLKEVDGFFKPLVLKLNKKILFHDEMINKIITDFNIREESHNFEVHKKLVGEARIKGKIDDHYYCYVVEVDVIVEKLKEYKEISMYELMNYNLTDFDKQILYHIILGSYFKLEL